MSDAQPDIRIKGSDSESSMIRIWYTVLSAVLSFVIALSSASDMRAQTCGGSFAKIAVVDSENTSVPDVTIELVAELPREEYVKYKLRKRYVEYGAINFKLSASEAEELITLAVPIRVDKDFCGNPLKQRANSTRVKNREDILEHRDGSVQHFGFCTVETHSRIYFLKTSAPGYVTDYYIGTYLGGCRASYSFVLSKSPETTNSTRHKKWRHRARQDRNAAKSPVFQSFGSETRTGCFIPVPIANPGFAPFCCQNLRRDVNSRRFRERETNRQ